MALTDKQVPTALWVDTNYQKKGQGGDSYWEKELNNLYVKEGIESVSVRVLRPFNVISSSSPSKEIMVINDNAISFNVDNITNNGNPLGSLWKSAGSNLITPISASTMAISNGQGSSTQISGTQIAFTNSSELQGRIIGLKAPSISSEATNKAYVDSKYNNLLNAYNELLGVIKTMDPNNEALNKLIKKYQLNE